MRVFNSNQGYQRNSLLTNISLGWIENFWWHNVGKKTFVHAYIRSLKLKKILEGLSSEFEQYSVIMKKMEILDLNIIGDIF